MTVNLSMEKTQPVFYVVFDAFVITEVLFPKVLNLFFGDMLFLLFTKLCEERRLLLDVKCRIFFFGVRIFCVTCNATDARDIFLMLLVTFRELVYLPRLV